MRIPDEKYSIYFEMSYSQCPEVLDGFSNYQKYNFNYTKHATLYASNSNPI